MKWLSIQAAEIWYCIFNLIHNKLRMNSATWLLLNVQALNEPKDRIMASK